MNTSRFFFSLCCLLLLLPQPPCFAAPETQDDFSQWLKNFRTEARRAGISAVTLDAALQGVEPLAWVIKADRSQPEFHIDLEDYLQGAVTATRIKKGQQLLQTHRALLEEIEARYRVQPRYLVALWGIESNFGRNPGSTPVISALVTLAYDARRSAYFRKELLYALQIVEEELIPLEHMQGSWAGAIGYLQFMPSTFVANAVDYDGNGRCEIWAIGGDLFASAANYLQRSGWQDDSDWGMEVQLTAPLSASLFGLDQQLSLSDWQARGVRGVDGQQLPETDTPASLLRPSETSERVFLVYNNYQTLLRWNRAHSFALAVGLLADRLAR